MYRGPSPSKVFIKEEPHCEEHDYDAAFRVKAEPECGDTGPSLESCSLEVCEQLVKEEPSCEERSGGPAGGAGAEDSLYLKHVVKEELVIGPEVWQQPALSTASTCREGTKAPEPTLRQSGNHSDKLSSRENRRKTKNMTHKQVSCSNCKMIFSCKSTLTRHQRRCHTGEGSFICDVCRKEFTQKGHLDLHLRIHSAEKPLQCNVCKMEFTERWKHTVHLRDQCGKKSFTCKICGENFADMPMLKSHSSVHSGEKPFSCGICDEKFTWMSDLSMHVRAHSITRIREYNRLLKDSKPTPTNLSVHSEEKLFECNVCNEKFARISDLTIHLNTHVYSNPM